MIYIILTMTDLTEPKEPWKTDLIHLIRELPDFDTVISEMRKKLAFLY